MDSLKEIIESILFVAGQSVEFDDIASKLNIKNSDVAKAVKELQKDKEKSFSGIQVQIFNNKAQLCSNPAYKDQVAEVLNPIKEKALTKAVLEVAAIAAYKQPLTRLDIEEVRGVNSDYAVNVLIENKLIEVVGRKDAIGKPLLYGTTDEFLKRFNMESITDLPDYEELINRIEVIRTPEKSLFDFSNLPDSEKPVHDSEEELAASEPVADAFDKTEHNSAEHATTNTSFKNTADFRTGDSGLNKTSNSSDSIVGDAVENISNESVENKKNADSEIHEDKALISETDSTMQSTMQKNESASNKVAESDKMINAFLNALTEEELEDELEEKFI